VFNKWLRKRKYARREASFNRGYSWAASELLKGCDEMGIEGKIEYAKDFGNYDDFEIGAEKALEDFRELKEMSSQKMLNNIFKH